MSWKKSAFSYLIWSVYTLITGIALVSQGRMFCVEAGIAAGWGILLPALYMGVVGGIVFLLHGSAGKRLAFAEKNRILLLVAETVLAAGFLVFGCFLRVRNMGEAQGASVYFEMAEVAAGQHIPQLVHGAVYFYVQLLHGMFLLLGNQYAAGIWLQICLQLAASVVLYFVLRKLSGVISALTVLGFCMCAPYMVQSALTLSPGMLYFLFLGAAAGLVLWLFGGRLRFPVFLLTGILSALCCYIDISGYLLLLLAVALVFSEQAKDAAISKRLAALGICLLAAVAGFFAFIWADAFMSGKDFWNVARAWFELYQPEGFRLPVTIGPADSGWEGTVLFGLMAFGVFGFWYDRKREYHWPYVVAACVVMFAVCFGIYTEEMSGFGSLYLIFVMLAGISLRQCICCSVQPENLPGIAGEADDVTKEGSPAEDFTAADGATEERRFAGDFATAAGEADDVTKEGSSAEIFAAADGATEERRFAGDFAIAAGDREWDNLAKTNERKAELWQEKESGEQGEPTEREEKKVRYLENPLPLPKKHVKRVMDYSIQVKGDDDFDYPLRENDDFDV